MKTVIKITYNNYTENEIIHSKNDLNILIETLMNDRNFVSLEVLVKGDVEVNLDEIYLNHSQKIISILKKEIENRRNNFN